MSDEHTTAVVQRYLDELGGDSPAEPIVRALLDRAVRRLHLLCATLLHRSYPRLTQPPLNLQADELLGAVTERLLKALREARPRTVRQFFALANQHMRWELNDLARRLDEQPAAVGLCEELVPSPVTSGSGLSPDGLRMLRAIESLPEDEREAFDLVRIQGLTQVGGRRVARRLGGDGEAAAGPRPAAPGGATGRPPPGRGPARLGLGACRQDGGPPGVAVPARSRLEGPGHGRRIAGRATAGRDHRVRAHAGGGLRRLTPSCCRRSAAAGGRCAPSRRSSMRSSRRRAMTPTPIPPLRGRRAPNCRGSRAMTWRRCSAAAAWASSTRPGSRGLNRPVALKMLLAGAYATRAERQRFAREAEPVAGLRHPNIVQVYDVGDLDGRPYFTMEFVEGGSLADAIAGTPRPARQAAELVATLAEAVAAAHRGGVVHRDLKPANVLLDGRRHAQGHRLRPGPATGGRRLADAERRPGRARRATWPPSRRGARTRPSGRRPTCMRWGPSSTSCSPAGRPSGRRRRRRPCSRCSTRTRCRRRG